MPGKTRFISELTPGLGDMEDIFLLVRATQGKARNGPFWTLTLQDSSGQVDAKLWSPLSQSFSSFTPGQVVLVRGRTGAYQDRLQITIDGLRILNTESPGPNDPRVDMDQLTMTSEVPPENLLAKLKTLLREGLVYPPWRKLAESALNDPVISEAMLSAPGGKAIHHAYRGGLLEHTLSVCQMSRHVCEHYPQLDSQILLVAGAFHDLGKAFELVSEPAPDYTDQGRLLGHIPLGLEVLQPYLEECGADPELILHFKHILLSHHGEYEYGSPKRPKTAEAMILHYLDNMDAKLNQIASIFEDAGDSDEPLWSPYQTTLQRFLYKPKPTPDGNGKATTAKKKDNGQCSLPLKA
ncbi:MAG: HD domain-containing protein [Desulfovibrio sp.]|nr:MAG: HD domain-containing protein [Desulfovibrio sp.]